MLDRDERQASYVICCSVCVLFQPQSLSHKVIEYSGILNLIGCDQQKIIYIL
jgi:hypothetical protein